jgi:hypothetical protein
MGDYPAFGKIPRLNRDIVVTEKMNGTNGLISIRKSEPGDPMPGNYIDVSGTDTHGTLFDVVAGSRNRWLFASKSGDNFGFAQWVHQNALALWLTLGEGLHYGEWFGSGIQGNNYGLAKDERRFALFNTSRWTHDAVSAGVEGLTVVPVLYDGPFNQYEIQVALGRLRLNGSLWSRLHLQQAHREAEGVIVYHVASRQYFKVTSKNDEAPKSAVG